MDLTKFFEDIEDDFDVGAFDDPTQEIVQQALSAFEARAKHPLPFGIEDMEVSVTGRELYGVPSDFIVARSPYFQEDTLLSKVLGSTQLQIDIYRSKEVSFDYSFRCQLGSIEIGRLKVNKQGKIIKSGFKIP